MDVDELELDVDDGRVPRPGAWVLLLLVWYFGMNLDAEGTELR